MIKRILQFFLMLTLCVSAHSQVDYNSIATAYVTTTISQNVVFDSTMQAGGTFTFSVLAHNGGGRAGQADTANVKIQFYNSSNVLISTVNSNYSANLPIPTAQDPPRADPAVPWTVLTTSSTDCGGSCAGVAYAKVSMYGVDASFWAGDYGPWYRAPTLQLNGSANLLYNPEFGPAYGYNAQGWTTSPAMGACQGAWGGSNPCIVNSAGVPGTSTVGLVANANGGGPSATGGTTTGTAGGYNSTMSVTNAGAGTGLAAPTTPTVTGTSVTYTIRTVVTSPGVTSVYKTPVTTTTYSDGTSTSTNGTETLSQTKVASNVVTNKIVNGVLTVTTTPIYTVTDATTNAKTIEANGNATTTSQNVLQGLNYKVYDFDAYTYSCGIFGCLKNLLGPYTVPNLSPGAYNQVASGRTTNGIYVPTNGSFPGMGDGTLVSYTGTITAPITSLHAAGTVYRLYFYSNSDDGFVLDVNGNRVINDVTTFQLQNILGGYTASGWIDVVAGQTYNLQAWYWNDLNGYGLRFQWDYGAGRMTVPNSAFSTGWITETNTIDTSGSVYSNSSIIDMSGTTVVLGPTVDGGTITQTNAPGDQIVTSSNIDLTTEQQTKVNAWNNSNASGNSLYIDQISGSNNAVTIQQEGNQNKIEMTIDGSSNIISSNQVGSNYLRAGITGDSNSLTTNQNSGTGSNYAETTILGANNTVNHTQTGNANKILFNSVNGNSNSVLTTQTGTGAHFLETKITGNGNSVLVDQSGNTANKATIDITNAGGPASVDLQQTGGKNFSIIQSCSNPAGCTTVVRQ